MADIIEIVPIKMYVLIINRSLTILFIVILTLIIEE